MSEKIKIDNNVYSKMLQGFIDCANQRLQLPHDDVWVKQDEAMSILRINSKTTLAKMRNFDTIKFSQIGKHIIYNKASIHSFINQNANKL